MDRFPCFLWEFLLFSAALLGASLNLFVQLLYRERVVACVVHSEGILKRLFLQRLTAYISSLLFGLGLAFSLLLLVFEGWVQLYLFALVNVLFTVFLYLTLKKVLERDFYPEVVLYILSKYLPWLVLIPLSLPYAVYLYNHLPLGAVIPNPDAGEYERFLRKVYLNGYRCAWVGFAVYLLKLADYTVWSLQLYLAKVSPLAFKLSVFYQFLKEGFVVWSLNALTVRIMATLDILIKGKKSPPSAGG